MWFLSLSLEDHLNTILIQYRSCNGGQRGAWEDFMKNTESGPPRSSGPLTHVNSAPVSVPCLETVVSLCTAYSHRKPQIQLSPHPQVPCIQLFLQNPGSPVSRLQSILAGGYRQVSGTVVPGPTGASRAHHEWFEN